MPDGPVPHGRPELERGAQKDLEGSSTGAAPILDLSLGHGMPGCILHQPKHRTQPLKSLAEVGRGGGGGSLMPSGVLHQLADKMGCQNQLIAEGEIGIWRARLLFLFNSLNPMVHCSPEH